jgi:class 3 adenylate cyclase/tetratricopeptide (TPR) repeat protein
MSEQKQIEQAIAALEAQRVTLGDAVVDAALTALRDKLAALESREHGQLQRLKYITALFADVVDSTRMGQALDPEDTHAIMDGALSRFAAVVEAHGGRVLRFMGDGLSAAFGADTSREDDPERAVRAGLALLADVKLYAEEIERDYHLPGFTIRVGINTGQVLLGGGVEADNSVMGMTVNLARRMEESAPVGGLRISHDTWRHVRGLFDASEQPPILVKGSDTPLRTYLVQRAKTRALRINIRGIEGIETRMVGRETELDRLKEAFATVCDERTLAAITVVGDAGLGKSRLMKEFLAWTQLQAQIVWLFQARANPESLGQPYGRMRELFTSSLQTLDSDPGPTARQKFLAGVTPFLASEVDAHVLGHLLGFDFSDSPHVSGILADAKQIRDRAFHYGAQYFRRVSQSDGHPVLLVLDDLHWADEGSLDFVNHLIADSGDVPLLIVGLARPTLYERRPLWGNGQQIHSRIDLLQLSRTDSREFAEVLLQRLEEIPATLSELITSGAEGNPFYMEELVKMLIDDGVIVTDTERWRVVAERFVTTHVPATLTGVLQARLDSLTPKERSALQLAAVIGHVFWEDALQTLDADAPHALPSLMRRELVFAHETSAFEGVREDVFKHHVLHQVTYDSVLKRIKREAHGKVAAWLIGQRGAAPLALIAVHYERAGDTANAVEYLQRTAEDAATRYAHGAALDYVTRALAITADTDAARRFALLLVRERIQDLQAAREAQGPTVTELERLAEQLRDDTKRAEAAVRRANYVYGVGDFPQLLAASRRAVALAETGAPAIAASAHRQLADALLLQGDYAAAQAHAETGLVLARAGSDQRIEALLLNVLGPIACEQGDYASAQAFFEEALALARSTADRRHECVVLNNLAEVMRRHGNYATARAQLMDGLRRAREIGDRVREANVFKNLALVEHNLGDHAAAHNHADAALALSRAIGARYLEAGALRNRGHAELGLDQAVAAAIAYAASRDLFHELGMPNVATESVAGLARIALSNGDVAAALAHVESILAHLDRGGTLDGADEPLRVRLTCYRVLDAAGDARAAGILTGAYTALQQQVARLPDATARMFLEAAPHHREIVAAWAAHQGTTQDTL